MSGTTDGGQSLLDERMRELIRQAFLRVVQTSED